MDVNVNKISGSGTVNENSTGEIKSEKNDI